MPSESEVRAELRPGAEPCAEDELPAAAPSAPGGAERSRHSKNPTEQSKLGEGWDGGTWDSPNASSLVHSSFVWVDQFTYIPTLH